jgi:hypothetical protein
MRSCHARDRIPPFLAVLLLGFVSGPRSHLTATARPANDQKDRMIRVLELYEVQEA